MAKKKKNEKKLKVTTISARLTQKEKDKIIDKADELGLNLSDYVRMKLTETAPWELEYLGVSK